jgi:hypothetical protein
MTSYFEHGILLIVPHFHLEKNGHLVLFLQGFLYDPKLIEDGHHITELSPVFSNMGKFSCTGTNVHVDDAQSRNHSMTSH